MTRRRRTTTLALLALIPVLGCGDSPSEPPGEPPALPSVESMQADVSLFDQANPAAAPAAAQVGLHFLTAAVAVTVARAATIVVMAIPVATFAAAASNDPVFEDGAFHWRYTVLQDGHSFEADLSGRGEGTESVWEMRISASATDPPLDDFLWYSGRANLGGDAGEWHVFDAQDPSSGTEVLDIHWTHPSADHWTLTFTNVNPAVPETGDQLGYEVDGDTRAVRFLDASEAAETEIQWNAVSKDGYIESPGYNGGVRACWDSELQDTTCPAPIRGS